MALIFKHLVVLLSYILPFLYICHITNQNVVLMTVFADRHRAFANKQRRRKLQLSTSRRMRYERFRRAQLITGVTMCMNSVLKGCSCEREMWMKERAHGVVFWNYTVQRFTDAEWRQHFRMGRNTFNHIATQLRPVLEKQVTNWRQPIDYRCRFAVVLWWLATPTEYRTLASMFGIGISTLCRLVREVCSGIKNILYHQYIILPSGDRLASTIEGFERRGFPQCAGAIDGSHIPIIAPKDHAKDYYNRKGWHSIVLQAVVDHNFCFTDIYVGWPGSTHDARVLSNSDIYKLAEDRRNGYLFPHENVRVVDGVEVPVCIIGDAAYPLRKWLMKGFTNNNRLTREQTHFTYRLSSARMVVENAFGRLKGRWRRLLKRNDIEVGYVSDVVAACCVLHNICEIHKEMYFPDWDRQAQREEIRQGLQQPIPQLFNENAREIPNDQTAADIRNTIMTTL